MCDVDYCERPGRNKGELGLCEAHYYQQRRGRPFAPVQPHDRRTGDPCAVPDCPKPKASGRYCHMHTARMARHGDPHTVIEPGDRDYPRGERNPMWTDAPTYYTIHQRLRSTRGLASDQTCGCGAPALHWSFAGERRPGERMPYSTALNDYVPRCVPCHKASDLASLRSVEG